MPITFFACVVTWAATQRARDKRQETEEPSGSASSKSNQDDEATTNDGISRESSVDTLELVGVHHCQGPN